MSASAVSRKGKTKAQIETEVRRREEEAVRLRAQNWSYDAISKELGWANGTAAKKAVQRALDRHEESNGDELRRVENAKLDLMEARLRDILNTRWVRVEHGKIVFGPDLDLEGRQVALEDPGPHLAAIREYRQVTGRRAALRGLDAPMRKVVEVITDDAVDAEIRRLEAMMEALSEGTDDLPEAS